MQGWSQRSVFDRDGRARLTGAVIELFLGALTSPVGGREGMPGVTMLDTPSEGDPQ